MDMNQLTLDAQIDQEHSALARAEQDALQILERLKAIPGTEGFLRRKRHYGELPNPWAGEGNMTAQAAVQSADPALASFLARKAGKSLPAPNYDRQRAQEELARQATELAIATEQMRERNKLKREQMERQRIYGTWNNFLGKVV